jgi:hypothetical protein
MNTGKHFFSQTSSDRKHLLSNNNQDDLPTLGAGASQDLKLAGIFKKGSNETPAKKINMYESMIEDTPSINNNEEED